MRFPATASAIRFRSRLGATGLRGAIGLLRLLGPRRSSDLGGWLACAIGRRLSANRVADRHLQWALPELCADQRRILIAAVWNNLGRNAGELPHLASFCRTEAGPGWEIEGEEHIDALKAAGTPALFFSGHFGNWELILPIAHGLGLPVSGFYRAASNRRIDAVIQGMRRAAVGPESAMFAKGAGGARQALQHLRAGGSLGMLVDQKMNDGIAVPFFGRPAMTAPALASLALKFGLPVVPIRVVRLGGQRFRMVCEAPLVASRTGDVAADVFALTSQVNEVLERWIRGQPEAWLWLHRRWPKDPPGEQAA